MSPKTSAPALALLFVAVAGCKASPPEPSPEPPAATTPAPSDKPADRPADHHERIRAQRAAGGDQLPKQAPEAPVGPPDPLQGKFSLDDATKGLPAGKQLLASIDTSMGKMECKLFSDKAPVSVANFVGLARGLRPWKTPEGTWETKPAYDGTIFHRIIKGFMIQGGDAKKNGSGEAGYVIPDEIWPGATHDRAGLLCMANRGPNTNSAQFFITDAAALHLDKGYTIFGECGPLDVVHSIASVEVQGQRPKTQVDIKKITITRK